MSFLSTTPLHSNTEGFLKDPNISPCNTPSLIEFERLIGITIFSFNLTFRSSEKLEFNDITYVLSCSRFGGKVIMISLPKYS